MTRLLKAKFLSSTTLIFVGIITYKNNNKYNLPEKVEDYLGNIQENEYTHVPKEYQIETEGNWKVTKSRAKVGKETFEQEREYDDETWNLIKEKIGRAHV